LLNFHFESVWKYSKVKRTDYLKQQKKFQTDPMSFMTQGRGFAATRIGGKRTWWWRPKPS
jgi:hypothetical protein